MDIKAKLIGVICITVAITVAAFLFINDDVKAERRCYRVTLVEGQNFSIPGTNMSLYLIDATTGFWRGVCTLTCEVFQDNQSCGVFITTARFGSNSFQIENVEFIQRRTTKVAGVYKVCVYGGSNEM